MMKRTRGLLAAVLIVLMGAGIMTVLVACGGSDDAVITSGGPLMIAADLRGDIVMVNKSSGATTPLLDVYNGVTLADIGPVSAMAYDAETEFIYAGTKGGSGDNGGDCNGCIYKIDPKTGIANLVLDFSGTTGHIYDLTLYNGLIYFTSDNSGSMYTVMPTYNSAGLDTPTQLVTGTSYSYWGSGLFSDQNDDLYVAGKQLIAVNGTTGSETLIGALTYPEVAPFAAQYPGFFTSFTDGDVRTLSAAVEPGSNMQYGVLSAGYHGTAPWYLTRLNAPGTELTYQAVTDRLIDGLAFVPLGVINSNMGQTPMPPSTVEAVAAYQSVLLGWTPVFGASSYRVYWSSTTGVTPASYDGMATVTGETYYVDSAAAGTTYYVVTAVRGGQESVESTEDSSAPGTDTGVEVITYAQETMTGSAVSIAGLTDDDVSGAINIGFDFNFFGSSYTQFYMTSNGLLSFDAATGDGCCMGLSIPLNDTADDIVAFAWGDGYPPGGGTIKYEVFGSAPDRRLAIDIMQDYYNQYGNYLMKAQVILYEGPSGTVEIHSQEVGEFSNLTQGVEDSSGSSAYYVPGRVATRYSLENDAVRFITNSITP